MLELSVLFVVIDWCIWGRLCTGLSSKRIRKDGESMGLRFHLVSWNVQEKVLRHTSGLLGQCRRGGKRASTHARGSESER